MRGSKKMAVGAEVTCVRGCFTGTRGIIVLVGPCHYVVQDSDGRRVSAGLRQWVATGARAYATEEAVTR